jgi:hypothetical protein
MVRARAAALVAATLVMLVAGCGTAPSSQANPPPAPEAGAPTAAVGANGQPIASLCDLLAEADFAELTGTSARKPAAGDATATAATCDYGSNLKLNVQVVNTVDDAATAYRTTTSSAGFTALEQGVMGGGVEESSYGTAAGTDVLNLRRLKLVVSIAIPAPAASPAPDQLPKFKLIQLAGRVLSRAHALGT